MTTRVGQPAQAPPFDPELVPVLRALATRMPPTLTASLVAKMRAAQVVPHTAEVIGTRQITHTTREIAGPAGAPNVTVAVFARSDHRPGGPGVLHIHGGGLVMGNRFTGLARVLPWVEEFDAVLVSVEYRLAPVHRYPAALDDCHAALTWTADHTDEFGIDPAQLLLVGASAGGGLAAALALRARDEGGPDLAGQLLVSPMLDDRNDSASSCQVDGIGVWDRHSNDIGWDAYLGPMRGSPQNGAYAAAARATDLQGLPPAYIDVGSVEVFRDECTKYAAGIWAAGGTAELHVWSGAFHSFDLVSPNATVSRAAHAARMDWLRRLLGY